MTGLVRELRDTRVVFRMSCPDHRAAGPVVFRIISEESLLQ